MKWLIELINKFITNGKKVKVDPDHLPGLRAPRSSPKSPVPPPEAIRPKEYDIDGIYESFLAAGDTNENDKHDRGVGF